MWADRILCTSTRVYNTDHASAAVSGKLYVFGGFVAGEAVSTAEAYDPASDSWAQVTSLTSARNAMVAIAL